MSQTRQAPASSSYDSVETDYDVVGNVSKVTLPYSGVAGALCSGTCPGTIFSYDASAALSAPRTEAVVQPATAIRRMMCIKRLVPTSLGEYQAQADGV